MRLHVAQHGKRAAPSMTTFKTIISTVKNSMTFTVNSLLVLSVRQVVFYIMLWVFTFDVDSLAHSRRSATSAIFHWHGRVQSNGSLTRKRLTTTTTSVGISTIYTCELYGGCTARRRLDVSIVRLIRRHAYLTTMCQLQSSVLILYIHNCW